MSVTSPLTEFPAKLLAVAAAAEIPISLMSEPEPPVTDAAAKAAAGGAVARVAALGVAAKLTTAGVRGVAAFLDLQRHRMNTTPAGINTQITIIISVLLPDESSFDEGDDAGDEAGAEQQPPEQHTS
jgi:hypothetical protein